MKILFASLFVLVLNIPFGYWRANVKRFSLGWVFAIHIPVPFIIVFRIFTELGWIRNLPDSLSNSLTDWQSTSEEQAEFITLFSIYTKELQPQIVIWSFLYDQPLAPELFRHAGLLDSEADITDMTVWQAWQQYQLNN